MKVSKNWLSEFVDLSDIKYNDLALKMTLVGNECDEVYKYCDATNLVVGYIESVTKHPNADTLNVCMVNIGNSVIQIVCGAKNVVKGIKVVVALVGAVLPGNFKIKESEIRGISSSGMICALVELGIDSKFVEGSEVNDGIHILSEDAPIGENALSYLKFDDYIADYELTANRSDLLNMFGMAYETAAILNKKITFPKFELEESNNSIDSMIDIEVKTDKCSFYSCRVVKDIIVKESPSFIKTRLMKYGIRPINNIVDISNYVMLEYGQPLHFFDYDKLGDYIVISDNEKNDFITLDGVSRNVVPGDIAIKNSSSIVALAGVMGGKSTEVDLNTKNILIEGAVFDSNSVRQTSKRIVRSESSMRFEKGINEDLTLEAVNRCCYLLSKYASGKVVKGVKTKGKLNNLDKVIEISLLKINSVLGMNLSSLDVVSIFERLNFKTKFQDDIFLVSVPSRRMDISIKEDLIEEIGRIYGYDNLNSSMPLVNIKKGSYEKKYKKMKDLKSRLCMNGLNEVITYSLINESKINDFTNDSFDPIKLLDPMSEDRSVLRYSLIPSLLEVANYNISRKNNDINIFEIASSYFKKDDSFIEEGKLTCLVSGNYVSTEWSKVFIKNDFYRLKGVMEDLFSYLGLNNRYSIKVTKNIPTSFHPSKSCEVFVGRDSVGFLGCVHPKYSDTEIYALELNLEKIFEKKVRNIKFKEIMKFPSITKDLAFVVEKNVSSSILIDNIKKAGGKLLKEVFVFDVYEGDNIENGFKSIAFKLVYSDNLRTLTDSEVIDNFNTVIKYVEKNMDAKLRN